jgi:hypothetical protein
MKKTIVLIGIALATSVSLPQRTDAGGVSFGIFYSSLSPHGEWISVDHDVYAWRPGRVAAGWRPYVHGYWAWSDYGWYWVSDEPWAWAAYHYGRWYYDDYYGWVWIPGYEWAPAWVEWRYGGDYLGWAPLGPYAVFSARFGIYYTRHWVTPVHWWSFVDCDAMHHRDVHRYIYRSDETARLIGRTRGAGSVRYENGRVVSRGPEKDYVERRTGSRLDPAQVVDSDDPGRQRVVRSDGTSRIEVYRPRIDSRSRDIGVDRPERVRSAERTLPLDTRNIDVRSKDRQREDGRDLRRAEDRRRDIGRPDIRIDRNDVTRDRLERPSPSMREPSPSPRPSVTPGPERRSRDETPRIERAPWPRERVEKATPAPEQRQRFDRPERSSRPGTEMRGPSGRREAPSRSDTPRRSDGGGRKPGARSR